MKANKQREEFLEEIRKALLGGEIASAKARSRPQAPHFPPSAERIEALSERFVEEVVRVGGLVHRAADASEVRRHLRAIAEKYNVKLAVRWDDPLLVELGVDEALVGAGAEVVAANLRLMTEEAGGEEVLPRQGVVEETRAYVKQKLARADLGVSGAHCAIAETGTLALIAGEGQGRAVTALPPVHVAVVEAERLVASVDEFFALLRRSAEGEVPALESCISFITGPSRSGDIELTLTLGVHGPRELHIILLGAGHEPG